MAPILAVASSVMIACGPFGSSPATRSPRAHPQLAQAGRHPGHLGSELTVGEGPAIVPFGAIDQRDAAGIGPCGPQRVTGVIDRRAAEPAHAGHGAAVQHRPRRAVAEHAEVVPDGGPETGRLADRPAPERVVTVEGQVALGRQPAQVGGDPGAFGDRRGGRPQHVAVPRLQQPARRRTAVVIDGHNLSIEPDGPGCNATRVTRSFRRRRPLCPARSRGAGGSRWPRRGRSPP